MTSVCLGNLCRHLILKSADYYTCADAISFFKACNQLFWLFWWHSREKLTGYYVHIVILLTSKFSNVVFCRKSQISTFPCTNTIIIWECCPLCQCRGRDKHNGGTAPTSRWWYLCHGFIISWQYNLCPYFSLSFSSLSLSVGFTKCNECCRNHRQTGPSQPEKPPVVHPGHLRDERRRTLRGSWLAKQSAQTS